ncbi:MAG: phosphomannomutase/phosphoglucomutase [Pseudoclavibacter sp.]|nr:phosphomannomutase/phosphoglucomutase [Pseudoclavibacter sp.]
MSSDPGPALPPLDEAEGADPAVFGSYDVRGLVGPQLSEGFVRAIGAAFADELRLAGREAVVGHDMRDSSPGFARAFAEGLRLRGANAVSIGLCSTDMNYYASGVLGAAAAMFTASHNPAAYNGIKMSRPGAVALSRDTGLAAIRDRAVRYAREGIRPAPGGEGDERSVDLVEDYAAHLRGLVEQPPTGRPLRVAVDAGNGMAGYTVPRVLGGRPELEIVPLYFELDGSFPNHEANPLDPENLRDLQAAVVAGRADLGLAFDGDADRCFVVDEHGEAVSPSAVTAIVARREVERARAAGEREITVLYNHLVSRHVPEYLERLGAATERTKVGHSLIKARMAATGAVFGGEHSAHYYFRDFWGADNGMLAALHVLAELAGSGRAMSELAAEHSPYAASGEINSVVRDPAAALERIAEAFAGRAELEEFDGLGLRGITALDEPFWWANVRLSNTEPLLRLNVESASPERMAEVRDLLLELIRSEG